ncbi:MAG: twin-arginine translocation pathway signal [Synechococcaceae cyanobacterium]|nr:twin-arginine translocation pathway signal [Synechococcaceae cyanobacterium]
MITTGEACLPRRRLLQLAALSGLGLLTGCRGPQAVLYASRGDIASAWTASLPQGWTVKLVEDPTAVLAARSRAQLLQLSDGWAGTLERAALQPIGNPLLLQRLTPAAASVSRLFGSGGPALAFPWAVSPWVLVLRNRPDLLPRADEGWDLLLDASLRQRLVLPSSPRVTMALIGEDPTRLARLRRAALASDDRDGLNLLLTGKAEAVVVPRQRVVAVLRRDPRLQVMLPAGGAPLSWNLLLRPRQAREAPPLDWLAELLEPPLLPRALLAGWVPPLPRSTLAAAVAGLPQPLASLLVPPAAWTDRCFSLPPLAAAERRRLQQLWDASAPAPGQPGA